jgi:hypothetical protein
MLSWRGHGPDRRRLRPSGRAIIRWAGAGVKGAARRTRWPAATLDPGPAPQARAPIGRTPSSGHDHPPYQAPRPPQGRQERQ